MGGAGSAVFGVDRQGPRPHFQRRDARRLLADRLTLRGLPTSERSLGHLMGERRCWWDGDHIVEIVDGGHPCDMRNLQTLCWWCHKGKSAEAAARRAEVRRMARQQAPEPATDAQGSLFAGEPPPC
jgi:hypothetical protein